MEVKKSIVITLTEDETKQMVVDYLKDKGYLTETNNVKFVIDQKVESYYDDEYGAGEYTTPYFKNVVVTIDSN